MSANGVDGVDFSELQGGLRQQGFLLIPGMMPKDALMRLDRITQELVDRWFAGEIADPDFWWYQNGASRVLYRIHNLERKVDSVAQLMADPHVVALVDSLMGVRAHVTACAMIYKTPGLGGPVRWHRDPKAVPMHDTYNFSFFLDDSDRGNGCFGVVPGSHLDDNPIADANVDPEGVLEVPASRGDVLVHDVRAVHGSWPATSKRQRRSIIVEMSP